MWQAQWWTGIGRWLRPGVPAVPLQLLGRYPQGASVSSSGWQQFLTTTATPGRKRSPSCACFLKVKSCFPKASSALSFMSRFWVYDHGSCHVPGARAEPTTARAVTKIKLTSACPKFRLIKAHPWSWVAPPRSTDLLKVGEQKSCWINPICSNTQVYLISTITFIGIRNR